MNITSFQEPDKPAVKGGACAAQYARRHLVVRGHHCGKNKGNNENYVEVELFKISHRLSYFTFFLFNGDKRAASKFQIISIHPALINKLIH